MKFKETKFEGLIIIEVEPFKDSRGFFMRTYDENLFKENGIVGPWVQDNHSKSDKMNTLRGLHFILPPYTDGKIIRCIKGEVMDVVVDLRVGSLTFGQYYKIILNEYMKSILYIPKGFAHGFLTLTDNCELIYKHDTFYNKNYDSGIIWNDSDLSIDWPNNNPIISEKDSKLMTFKEFKEKYKSL